jgi:hypothetical protein
MLKDKTLKIGSYSAEDKGQQTHVSLGKKSFVKLVLRDTDCGYDRP